MLKENDYIMKTNESPGQLELNEINYNCTECSSPIEIISINEKECSIEFQCINNNHKEKISIDEYIKKMKNFNNNNINNDICITHNKRYECFCVDCNLHLCKECLQSRNHINHIKNYFIEIQPNKKELNAIENIIEYYKEKIENLENEKINKTKELNVKLKEYKFNLKKNYEIKIKENQNKMEDRLKKNKDNYINDIEIIQNKCLNEIKKRKYQFENEINEIKNEYKMINEYNNTIYKNKLEKVDMKYIKEIQKHGYDTKLKNLNNLKRINDIIYNTYINFNNN